MKLLWKLKAHLILIQLYRERQMLIHVMVASLAISFSARAKSVLMHLIPFYQQLIGKKSNIDEYWEQKLLYYKEFTNKDLLIKHVFQLMKSKDDQIRR